MSRSFGLAVFGVRATILLAATGAADVLQPGVRGMVYGDDCDDPVPGALVVLYDSDDLLVDSTYTRDDGGFTLRPPQRKGPAYLVATRDHRAHREAIDYDPARSRPVWIPLPAKRESRLKQARGWVLDKFGGVIGLLVGYGFRVLVEERGAAKRKRDDFVFDLRELAGRALALPDDRPAELAAAVGGMRQLVDRRSDMLDVLSTLRLANREQGRASFRALDDRLKQAETLLAETSGLADVPRDEKLAKVREILVEIRDRPLELGVPP
jgi:hypothetical protein